MSDGALAFTPSAVTIREISSLEEMKAIERLQAEVWGYSELDVVPASELLVTAKRWAAA